MKRLVVVYFWLIFFGLISVSSAYAAPSISSVVDSGQTAKYGKFEITFDVTTSAGNLQFPYDASRGNVPGIDPADPNYDGISVDAEFTDPNGKVWRQPAFYFEEFSEVLTSNRLYPEDTNGDGKAFDWKIRFAPNIPGIWQYKLIAEDSSGTTQTGLQSFTVVDSPSKGFINVSSTDPRYFEFDDHSYFPGLGYNENYRGVDWVNFYTNNKNKFENMGPNGIQLTRFWLSQWPIYGSGWSPWKPYFGNGYLVANTLNFNVVRPGSELSMRLFKLPNGSGNNCIQWGWEMYQIPSKAGSQYEIQVRYKITNQEAPTDPLITVDPTNPTAPFGFAIKSMGWADTTCYKPGGTVLAADYDNTNGTTQDIGLVTTDQYGWQVLTNTFTASGSTLQNLHLTAENVDTLRVYIDSISIREVLGGGQYGENVIPKPDMDHHLYFSQRDSYAFDKTVELAEINSVYLKPVLLEKNDWIPNHIGNSGNFVPNDPLCNDGDPSNDPPECPGNGFFYGNWRAITKNRWLQESFWRYVQARWGYSTAIHSWELLNEGDPYSGLHWTQTDEFGKFMHCEVFGQSADASGKCVFDHPNNHLISTSTWHSLPADNFWTNLDLKYPGQGLSYNYPNVDFGDVHRYLDQGSNYNVRTEKYNVTFSNIVTSYLPSSASWQQYYFDLAKSVSAISNAFDALGDYGLRKPLIRGETDVSDSDGVGSYTRTLTPSSCTQQGQVITDSVEIKDEMLLDINGVGIHNIVWSQINRGGMYDQSFWWPNVRLYYSGIFYDPDGCTCNASLQMTCNRTAAAVPAYDRRPFYGPYYRFIKDIPLTNGNYTDLEGDIHTNPSADEMTISDPNIRVLGQKDVVSGNAHFWVQNITHTWRNVVCAGGGLTANQSTALECSNAFPLSTISNATITIGGFTPSTNYTLETWDISSDPVLESVSNSSISSDASGNIVISLPPLSDDIAFKIINPNAPTPSPTSSPNKPGDVDGDGDVDITDLASLLSTFGGSNPAADFNGSGTVDIADLATLLANFGT